MCLVLSGILKVSCFVFESVLFFPLLMQPETDLDTYICTCMHIYVYTHTHTHTKVSCFPSTHAASAGCFDCDVEVTKLNRAQINHSISLSLRN